MDLPIDRKEPPWAVEARELANDTSQGWGFHWKLVARVEVAWGRDGKAEREVRVTLNP